jgi:hypothetical protein
MIGHSFLNPVALYCKRSYSTNQVFYPLSVPGWSGWITAVSFPMDMYTDMPKKNEPVFRTHFQAFSVFRLQEHMA